MDRVYITLANSLKIVKSLDIKFNYNKENLYSRPIVIFNYVEKQRLKFARDFFRNSNVFLKSIYKSVDSKDTFSLIWEGINPAYHLFNDCSLLNSKYINYRVPFDVRVKGKEEVEKYRKWFITNLYLIESKPDAFAMRHHARWGFELYPKTIIKENSGSYRFENVNLEELKSRIDVHLDLAREYYYSSNKNMFILKKFAKDTYLAFTQKKIENNDTGLSDEELKIFLKEYDIKYKRPLKKDLIEYYRVKFNPKLQFEQNLLEQLGFNLCTKCVQSKTEQELWEKRRKDNKVFFCCVSDTMDDSPKESIPDVYFQFNIIEDELIINF